MIKTLSNFWDALGAFIPPEPSRPQRRYIKGKFIISNCLLYEMYCYKLYTYCLYTIIKYLVNF